MFSGKRKPLGCKNSVKLPSIQTNYHYLHNDREKDEKEVLRSNTSGQHINYHSVTGELHFDDGLEVNNSTKSGKKRTSITYDADSCHFQQEDTPYFVSLAARIFGIESQTGDQNKNPMNLPFEWEPNERISEDQFNATNNRCLWTQMPSSITSVNLTLCLIKELHDAHNTGDFLLIWVTCSAPAVIMAFFVELATVTALGEDYDDIDAAAQETFCQQSIALQCGVVGIFLISLLKPLYDILTEIVVGISSLRCVYDSIALQQLFIHVAGPEYGKGRKFRDTGDARLIVKEVETGPFSFFIYWLSVAVEAYVFYLTVIVGVYYTMSQTDASSIVQAAVAISFINEIDNILYDAISPSELKDVMDSCVYEVPIVPVNHEGGEKWWQFFIRQYQFLLQTPLLMILTIVLVFSLRNIHCRDEAGSYEPYNGMNH